LIWQRRKVPAAKEFCWFTLGRFAYQVSYWEAQVTGGHLAPADPDECVQQAAWIPEGEIAALPLSHEDQRWVLTAFLGKTMTGGM